MGRPAGQLDRALEFITVGLHQQVQHRHRMLADGQTGEFEQQVQVQLSGSAGSTWEYADTKVNFEFPFLFAPLQRRSEFDTPHFSKGIEVENPGGDVTTMVLLDAHVIGWVRSEENWIVGATIRFMATAPNALQSVPYSAKAHLRFQGYASYPEGDEVSL